MSIVNKYEKGKLYDSIITEEEYQAKIKTIGQGVGLNHYTIHCSKRCLNFVTFLLDGIITNLLNQLILQHRYYKTMQFRVEKIQYAIELLSGKLFINGKLKVVANNLKNEKQSRRGENDNEDDVEDKKEITNDVTVDNDDENLDENENKKS